MSEETAQQREPVGADEPRAGDGETGADLQAEQESAAAMDADVPQPPDESQADRDQVV
jgi:hypothetical protein